MALVENYNKILEHLILSYLAKKRKRKSAQHGFEYSHAPFFIFKSRFYFLLIFYFIIFFYLPTTPSFFTGPFGGRIGPKWIICR